MMQDDPSVAIDLIAEAYKEEVEAEEAAKADSALADMLSKVKAILKETEVSTEAGAAGSASPGTRLVSVERVENEPLWQRYRSLKDNLKKNCAAHRSLKDNLKKNCAAHADGILSLSTGGSIQRQDEVVQKRFPRNIRNMHSAARQLPFSGSDADSSDSGEAPPYHLSPLLALPSGSWKELKLVQMSPEIVKRIGRHLTAETDEMLRNLVETILKEQEAAGAKGTRSGTRGVLREGGWVQRQRRRIEEENRVLKGVLEDLHAWPIQVVAEVEVSQLMGALSLSAEERAGEESVVFPLVVVRVLQVSYCLFQSMCCICPSVGTDATELQDGTRLAATQFESAFRLYEV